MSTNGKDETVLVSGGSGFLAGWIIIELLRLGYRVHATLRDTGRQTDIRTSLVAAGGKRAADQDALRFYQANLDTDEGWQAAIAGCRYAIHTASPFPVVQPKNEDEVIVPARDGTLRVLRASLTAGVEHVVITSSASAMEYPSKVSLPTLITEASWTDLTRRDITAYIRSKTIAERAAWDFVAQHSDKMSLTAIAPTTMLGPILGKHVTFSVQSVQQLLDGSAPAIPRLGFGFVDVRDVAALHVEAMVNPRAAGERFLAGGTFLWLSDIAKILRRRMPEASSRVPSHTLPNIVARGLSLFNPSLRSVINDLGKTRNYSPKKAEELLGWTMRPIEDTITDTARSLQATFDARATDLS